MTLLSSTSYVLLDISPDVSPDISPDTDPPSSGQGWPQRFPQSFSQTFPQSWPQRWQVWLNRICLMGVAPWLADEFGIAAAQVEAMVRSHTTIWPLVDGSAVPIDAATRVILIPSTAIDQSELRVPQEWVDIPHWVGDYYVAVRINPEGHQLCVWGYTTHAQLKQTARYDADDRSYCLDHEDVTDLAVLHTARALGLAEANRTRIAALPVLPAAQVDSLVQRLTERLMPRVMLPFALWGALVADETSRSRLLAAPPRTPLSQWLSRLAQANPTRLTQGWQPLSALLSASQLSVSQQAPQAALAMRANEPAGVQGGKRLRLAPEPDGTTVILLLTVAAATKDQASQTSQITVQVQLRPEPDEELPADLALSLLSPAGDCVQQVSRQPLDDYIQLKRFRLPPGYDFTIQVRSGRHTVQEPFTT